MAVRKDGTPPTAEELRKYADYLEEQVFRINKEMADAQRPLDHTNQTDIKVLNLQQERIMDDIRSINSCLKDLASQLTQIPVLANKQDENYQAMARAHKRLDKLNDEFVAHKEKFETRLQDLQVHQAKGAWLERLGMAIVLAAVTLWAKGGL